MDEKQILECASAPVVEIAETLAADDPRHGTWNGYNNLGCRCAHCAEAKRVYLLCWRQGNPLHALRKTERQNLRYGQLRAAGFGAKEASRLVGRSDSKITELIASTTTGSAGLPKGVSRG